MKKLLVVIAITGIAFSSLSHAGRIGTGGVKSISKAGGDRFHVYCNNGGSRVITPVGRGWGDDTHNSFGESYYGLSLQEAAQKGCS